MQTLSLQSKSSTGAGEEIDGESGIDIEKSILPSLISFLLKLDSELLKAFQTIPHVKFEYLQRVRDENLLLFLCDSLFSFVDTNFP
jgi:hypothetical protein